MLNCDGRLWTERRGRTLEPVGTMSQSDAEWLLGTIAGTLDTVVNRQQPIVEGELILDGSRFQGLLPPVVKRPVFAIRLRITCGTGC